MNEVVVVEDVGGVVGYLQKMFEGGVGGKFGIHSELLQSLIVKTDGVMMGYK